MVLAIFVQVGLHSWNSVVDANGLSPYAYALMRNNHTYNELVAQKLVDKRGGEVSVTIEVEDDVKYKEGKAKTRAQQSCSRCAYGYRRSIPGSKGLLQRPYVHSMLLVAAVCACVCLFLRGHPFVGCVSPFSWENLEYGTIWPLHCEQTRKSECGGGTADRSLCSSSCLLTKMKGSCVERDGLVPVFIKTWWCARKWSKLIG